MNKRGWIKIVEAFIAILVVVSAVLIIYGREDSNKNDLSSTVYPLEISILRDVELDSTLRQNILSISQDKLPIEWEDFEKNGLLEVKNRINSKVPSNLECVGKICELGGNICDLKESLDKDIYAQSIPIVANSDIYSPKQLKLFCYTK